MPPIWLRPCALSLRVLCWTTCVIIAQFNILRFEEWRVDVTSHGGACVASHDDDLQRHDVMAMLKDKNIPVAPGGRKYNMPPLDVYDTGINGKDFKKMERTT